MVLLVLVLVVLVVLLVLVLVVLVLVVVVVPVLVVVVAGGRWWWCVWWYWYSCWCVRGSSVGGDGGAKVLERVGAWWLWGGRGGSGGPKLSTCRGHKKKATEALLASFSMRIFFDAGVIFFHSHSKAAVLKLG